MTIFKQLRRVLLPALGGVAGLAVGCVITTGSKDCTACGNTFCNSVQVGSECFCDSGYQFKEPNNPNDFECVRIPGKGGSSCPDPNSFLSAGECFCDPGYNWCNPNAANDLTCCLDDDQVLDGTGGHTSHGTGGETDTGHDVDTGDTDGPTCNFDGADPCPAPEFEPDPADCTEDGLVACSNTVEMGPECSVHWTCMAGEWVDTTNTLDEACIFSGADFAFGCEDDGTSVAEVCGFGPGTPCEGECSECVDSEIIQFCALGKVNQDNCFVLCTEFGDADGVTYDHGECIEGECACCDIGEEGCVR